MENNQIGQNISGDIFLQLVDTLSPSDKLIFLDFLQALLECEAEQERPLVPVD